MEIYFDLCDEADFDFFYELKADKENILWTGHAEAPRRNNLKEWYLKQLKREDRYMFMVKSTAYPNDPIGYLYLDVVGEMKNIIEIGDGVNSKFTSKGIGTKIIEFAIDYIKNNLPFIVRIDGWIAQNNFGSIKTFIKNGFSETKETKETFFKGFNQYLTMKKYYYPIK